MRTPDAQPLACAQSLALAPSLLSPLGSPGEQDGAVYPVDDPAWRSLTALVAALEARDRSSFDHSHAVADYAELLGRALGWNPVQLGRLRFAALLHDLGKIGIPDHVLLKPSQLTREEEGVMMRHPEIGSAILSTLRGLEDLQMLVRHHHEWYDGAGYPTGLAGDEIPHGARLLGVVDAFDAMTSDRSHRAGMTVDEALDRLREGAGRQFDPHLVELFLPAVLDEWRRESARGERLRASTARARERAARGQAPQPYLPFRRPDPDQARGGRILFNVLRQADAFWDFEHLLGRISAALMQELPGCEIRGLATPSGRRLGSSSQVGGALHAVTTSRLPRRAWLPLYAGGEVIAYLEVVDRGSDTIRPDDWDVLNQLAPQLAEILASTRFRGSG